MKVMQCWDDGVVNDEPLVKLLRQYHAKATFNINPGGNPQHERKVGGWMYRDLFRVDRLSLDEMKDLYKGFTIAGHSWTHPHAKQIDPAVWRDELVRCKQFIREYFGQERCGMAYPFGEYNEETKRIVQETGYLYSRTCANISGVLPLDDPMELPSHCHFMSPDFWTKYEEVRQADGVFYFWGHSYEMMNEGALWEEFESKLARIDADPKAEWIDIVDLF